MSRFFNTAGPIKKEKHYNIDPLTRIDFEEILSLIEQEKYFVLHAPRQSGKTSYLHALRDYLAKQGQYKCLYINVEEAQTSRENVKEGIRTILNLLAEGSLAYFGDSFLEDKEDRVRRVIGPLLTGSQEITNIPTDDLDYVVDLGLVKKDREIGIANRIYREVIPRELTYTTQLSMNQESSWYMKEDGRLDMEKLLGAFQAYFRENFESWVDGFSYKEAGPQLLLQAFLQRIVNHGGRVEREYGLGRQRTDLLVIWPFKNKECIQQVVVELKLRYGKLEETIGKGLEQTWEYMDRCGAGEGYLLVFDRSKKAWKDKIFKKEKTFKGSRVMVYGM